VVPEDQLVAKLRGIHTFPQLKLFLSEHMDWPVGDLKIEDITFDYEPEEIGLKPIHAAKIKVIKRLRSLAVDQPWGIFFIEFEKKNISVEVLRRILGHVAIRKRSAKDSGSHAAWASDDLLFISNYGDTDDRRISFAQFSNSTNGKELAKLKVLAWDSSDAALHLEEVARNLTTCLSWPEDENDLTRWRARWRQAFRLEHREVITTSESLALRLADLAQLIRNRMSEILDSESDNGPFQLLMKGFKDSLVEDLDVNSFSDMYAQTITYGLLSARIAGADLSGQEELSLHLNASPFLRELMEAFWVADGSRGRNKNLLINFDELGVQDVIEALNLAKMEDIVRNFGDKNFNEDPITHFYETFLSKYDPLQRVQRGVFYTPQPVVKSLIRSVHLELIEVYGFEDGLASVDRFLDMSVPSQKGRILSASDNEFAVTILDPATGTGTFLVEAIETIYQTLFTKWRKLGCTDGEIASLWSDYVPLNLLPRLFGYELLMAPYAIAHLKVSLKLVETGYKFGQKDRINIFLTNALSGPRNFEETFEFAIPALDHEAHAVNEVKLNRRFSVVIGNPPYSGISSNMNDETAKSIEPYKYIAGEHFGERKHWLQDDYVKFIRLAEMQIEQTGFGVIGYITNHAFIDNPTFRGMRWHLLETFTNLFIVDLHGNVMKQEAPPAGMKNENVFDIQQGVAMFVFSRSLSPDCVARLSYGDMWGTRTEKYAVLNNSSVQELAPSEIVPTGKFYFFRPHNDELAPEYSKWPQVSDIFQVLAGGFITARDHFVVDMDKEALFERIRDLRSTSLSDSQIRRKYFHEMGSAKYPDGDTRGWKLSVARDSLRRDTKWREHVRSCLYRPFDERWVYWKESMVDWMRPETNGHLLNEGNIGLVVMRQVASSSDYTHVIVSRSPVDNRACYSNKGILSLAPLYLHDGATSKSHTLFSDSERTISNFMPDFSIRFQPFIDSETSNADQQIFDYVLGILSCVSYRKRYVSLLKIDFPRVPIPTQKTLFAEVSKLGSRLISLQLLEEKIALIEQPKYFGSKEALVNRVYHKDDVLWIDSSAKEPNNATSGFSGVSGDVFRFELGGYQICEKWFKDRRGQSLSQEERDHARKMLASISKIIAIQAEIDQVVEEHGGFPDAFI
jgi:predicted helicase